MASTLLQFDMRFDPAVSPPTTPVVRPRLWDFLSSFIPKSWGSGTMTGSPTTTSMIDESHSLYSSHELAAILQTQFDEENRQLLAERAELEATAQRAFDCGVCMDTLPEDSIARIEPCGHPFCRDCVRGLITSQIESRRFPVLCPTCTVEPGNDLELIGNVTRGLVLDIGITEEQYDTWIEIEMSKFLIRLQCRRCTRTSFFDKEEFEGTKNLKCPQADCNYAWCKDCQQEIAPNGPEHSCDGSSEMKHLVQERGWKHCPMCGTPCEKISGCNHVSCITPGCNTQFCYGCGGLRSSSSVLGAIAANAGGNTERCRC